MNKTTKKHGPDAYFEVNRDSTLVLSDSLAEAISSLVASNATCTWLNGFSSLFSNSFLQASMRWFLRSPGFSSSISGMRRASNAAYAALYRRSGCRSILEVSLFVNDSASSALSIPDALRSPALRFAGAPSSSWDRSRPRDGAAFFWACLALPPLGLDGCEASSAARRASRSAFLRAASAFLASASSLFLSMQGQSLVRNTQGVG